MCSLPAEFCLTMPYADNVIQIDVRIFKVLQDAIWECHTECQRKKVPYARMPYTLALACIFPKFCRMPFENAIRKECHTQRMPYARMPYVWHSFSLCMAFVWPSQCMAFCAWLFIRLASESVPAWHSVRHSFCQSVRHSVWHSVRHRHSTLYIAHPGVRGIPSACQFRTRK